MQCKKCNTTEAAIYKGEFCNSCYTKQWRIKNAKHVLKYLESVEARFFNSKKKSKKRKIEWKLSLEEYKEIYNKPCFYCDNKIGKMVTQSCGLDRLNNDLGYQIDNVVPCCTACNVIRNEVLTSEEMKEVAKFIISLRKKHNV